MILSMSSLTNIKHFDVRLKWNDLHVVVSPGRYSNFVLPDWYETLLSKLVELKKLREDWDG